MRKTGFIFVISAMLFASTAFADRVAGQRPSNQPKFPADAPNAQATQNPSNVEQVIVEVSFDNFTTVNLICDAVGWIEARHISGVDRADLLGYVKNRRVLIDRGFRNYFTFDKRDAGTNYKLQKKSQQYELSCKSLNDFPGQTPTQLCNPEQVDCDWTCQADQQNSGQCAEPTQDWPDPPEPDVEWEWL
jgi:hypothetical protein